MLHLTAPLTLLFIIKFLLNLPELMGLFAVCRYIPALVMETSSEKPKNAPTTTLT